MTAEPPIVKLLSTGSDTNRATSPAGLSRIDGARRFADRLETGDVELLRALHLRLLDADHATRRNRSGFGRLFSWTIGQRADYIAVPGGQLPRILSLAGWTAPDRIPAGAEFLLRTDVARVAYSNLKAMLAASPRD